jgi:hypothetical protein
MLMAIALALLPQTASASTHRLHIGKGPYCQIAIDGKPQSYAQTRSMLTRSAHTKPEPTLQLDLNPGAPYWCVEHVLAEIKQAKVTKIVFLGNEKVPPSKPVAAKPAAAKPVPAKQPPKH